MTTENPLLQAVRAHRELRAAPARRGLRLPTARREALATLGRFIAGATALAGPAWAGRLAAFERPVPTEAALPRPDAWRALLHDAAVSGHPVVVLFSAPGCAYCRFVRVDHLRHLAARTPQRSGIRIVELSLTDRRPFAGDDPASPAELAAMLGIRFAPTVAFFGPEGELAERLVGYQSADFYGAYLDQRIATAVATLRGAQGRASADG